VWKFGMKGDGWWKLPMDRVDRFVAKPPQPDYAPLD
jgi:hypothetical protein